MATQRQIDSARRNGALSRGPVTAEGRTKSSKNSLKHGMTAKKIFVLANESSEAFNKVVEGFLDHYQPANDLERELCLNIAYAHWRLRRLAIIETALFDKTMVEGEGVDEGLRLASAFESLVGDGALTQLTQYEARLHRTIHRLSERLEKIQKAAAAATEPPHGTATGRERTQNTPPPAATSIRERATITPINSKNEPDLSATPDPDEQSLPPFVSPYN